MKEYILENEKLFVAVVPEMGGKTISIYEKAKKFELLAVRRWSGRDSGAAAFADCAAFGFDDAFPCIDPGEIQLQGKTIRYPDHGEIWSADMEIRTWDTEKAALQLLYESQLWHYRYQKNITLEDNTVRYSYRITNQGEEDFPCIWAFHCLVRYEEDMRIVFPSGTKAILNVLKSTALGKADTVYSVTKTDRGLRSPEVPYRFDGVPDRQSCSMEKYYVADKVGEGICGYDYPSWDMTCRISYDCKKLPYLGFFVTAGGFMGDYNCALEPCDGYYDSVANALNRKRCIRIKPGECREFELKIALVQKKIKGGTYGNSNFKG